MEPTEGQKAKFWKWCGFKVEMKNQYSHSEYTGAIHIESSNRVTVYPDGKWDNDYPPLDLNNLFKWATLKVRAENMNLDSLPLKLPRKFLQEHSGKVTVKAGVIVAEKQKSLFRPHLCFLPYPSVHWGVRAA